MGGAPGYTVSYDLMAAGGRQIDAPMVWGLGKRIGIGVAALALALAPWWRNHARLRDFFDYGLVVAGIGRIARGEHPYVDFATPIQTAIFWLNGWAEHLGGGTLLAMTWSGAVLIVFGLLAVAWSWRSRSSNGMGWLLALVVVSMTASQHTILWHNTLGGLLVVFVALAGTSAPIWTRTQWISSLAIALALVLGGMVKLNTQLIAVVVSVGWAMRAGMHLKATKRQVVATLVGIVVAGFVVPILLECATTGASFGQWWHNVVVLPFVGRASTLEGLADPKFYFTTWHPYYGALALPPLGAIGVVMTLVFGVVAWVATPTLSGRLLAIMGAVLALGGGLGLLATNNEIAYVAMGVWVGLLAALWRGFGLVDSWPRMFRVGLVWPMVVLGVIGWQSAWVGQRSQFGNSNSTRGEYVPVQGAGEVSNYLQGMTVAPSVRDSLAAMAEWRATLTPESRREVWYAAGVEWLDRVWPIAHVKGLPLWYHEGTSYSGAGLRQLALTLSAAQPYRYLVVALPWEAWNDRVARVIHDKFHRQLLGPEFALYRRPEAEVVSLHPWEFINQEGGNVDPRVLHSTMESFTRTGDRRFVGTDSAQGELRLAVPSYRLRGEAIVRRARATGPIVAKFTIVAVKDEAEPLTRWEQEVRLAAGETEKLVPFQVDSLGRKLDLRVTIPGRAVGDAEAGWTRLALLNSIEQPGTPTALSGEPMGDLDPAMRAALLPPDWAPSRVLAARGVVRDGAFLLAPGGEVWIKLDRPARDVRVAFTAMGGTGARHPVVRMGFYKGGRLEVFAQNGLEAGKTVLSKGWSAELGGWLVAAIDPVDGAPAVSVRVASAEF